MPLGVFLTLVPLTVLWSPLGALGVLPFALMAGGVALVRGEIVWRDVALPALACVFVGPVLLYLSADPVPVGGQAAELRLATYAAFIALEVAPLLLIAAWAVHERALGRTTLAAVAGMLLLLPWRRSAPRPTP